jgi:hypothetical protein
MKGIIFRELLNLTEELFGYETVDEIIEKSNLKSKGVYTSVGTYPHAEVFELVKQLSIKTNLPEETLFKEFGKYAFGVFSKSYPNLMVDFTDALTFLQHIEDTIHVEVLKLYPEAELPKFIVEKRTENELILNYSSERKMSDLAEGLIQGCFEHYKIKATLKIEVLKTDKSNVRFIINKINDTIS